ncbi:MAG TPA: outer membrane beta-barrel protein [Pirellulaceae bacterium]
MPGTYSNPPREESPAWPLWHPRSFRALGRIVMVLMWCHSVTASSALGQERWWLMRSLQGSFVGWQLDSRRIEILGWTEGSYTASSASDQNLPLGLNYLANEFALQQNWLRIDRPVDPEGQAMHCGFRSDWILPGTDYRFTLPRGLWNGQLSANDGQPALYGVDAVQFYGEVFVPRVAEGMTVKVGRFFLPYGVETTEAITTPLASRSYGFIYNPFTQFGLLTTTKLNEAWSVVWGLSAGNDVLIDPANEPTLDLGFKWTDPLGHQSVNVFAIVGESRFNVAESFNHPSMVDIVYTRSLTARLNYSGDFIAGYQRDVPDQGTVTWQGLAQYLTYRCSPHLSANTRIELFHDEDGNRTGSEGLYTALTAGLTAQPVPNLIVRPELRCDYNDQSRPFEGEHALFTAAADVIVRW